MIFVKRRVQKGFDEEAASRKAARSHFRDWIDYCGVAFLQEFTGMWSHIFRIFGARKFWYVGFKNSKVFKKCVGSFQDDLVKTLYKVDA